jgi:2-dehydropantoate 2-reductase
MLERAGFPTSLSRTMDGWLRTHAIFVSCVSAALALEGGDSVRLGQNRARVTQMVSAIREGFTALQSQDITVTPFNLQLIFRWIPRWFAVRYCQHTLQTSVETLAIAPHANAAREEMGMVAREVLELLQESPVPTPSLQRLLAALAEPVLHQTIPHWGVHDRRFRREKLWDASSGERL